MRVVTSLLLAGSLAACSTQENRPTGTTARDSLGIRVTETDASLITEPATSSVVESPIFRVGSANDEADAEPLFDVRAALFLPDTSLLLLQAGAELLFIGPDGLPRARAGRRGEGPGEFAEAVDLRLTEDGLVEVWDADLGRVTVLETDGSLVETRSADLDAAAATIPEIFGMLPAFRWRLIGDDRLLAFSYSLLESIPESERVRPWLSYLTTPLAVDQIDTLGTYASIEQMRLPPELGGIVVRSLDPDDAHYSATASTGHIYIGDSGEDFIDRYDASGQLDLRVGVPNADRTPQPEARSQAIADLADQLQRRGIEGTAPALLRLAAEDPAPAFRALHADQEAGLWVQWSALEQGSYARFDPTGVFTGTVRLPPHERILAVASGRIAVLERSELGIESVAVYRTPNVGSASEMW